MTPAKTSSKPPDRSPGHVSVPRRGAQHGFAVLAYRDSPFLESCVRSLVSQSSGSGVLISTSTPSPHIDRIAGRYGVPVIVSPGPSGIGPDWNFALRQGDWPMITLAHQDDLYDPEFARRSVEALSSSDAAIAFTGHREISDDGAPSTTRVIRAKHLLTAMATGGRPRLGPMRRWALLAFGNPVACSSVTFHRERLGAFRFDEGLRSNLDWAAWWELHRRGLAFAFASEPLVLRRYNDLSATAGLLRNGTRLEEDRLMFRRIWPRPAAECLGAAYRLGYR
jgi:hypothetical protein